MKERKRAFPGLRSQAKWLSSQHCPLTQNSGHLPELSSPELHPLHVSNILFPGFFGKKALAETAVCKTGDGARLGWNRLRAWAAGRMTRAVCPCPRGKRLCVSQKSGPTSEGLGDSAMLVKAGQPTGTCQVFLVYSLRGCLHTIQGCYCSSEMFLGSPQGRAIVSLCPPAARGGLTTTLFITSEIT